MLPQVAHPPAGSIPPAAVVLPIQPPAAALNQAAPPVIQASYPPWGWLQGNNAEWVPPDCGTTSVTPCVMHLHGSRQRLVLKLNEPDHWYVRRYRCVTHDKTLSALDENLLPKVMQHGGLYPTSPLYVFGGYMLTYELANYIWKLAIGSRHSANQIRSQLLALWLTQAETNFWWYSSDLAAQSDKFKSILPSAKIINTWIHAMWAVRSQASPLVSDADLLLETRTLAFDFTYNVGAGIWVLVRSGAAAADSTSSTTTRDRRIRLVFLLASIVGHGGKVVAMTFVPTERHAWCFDSMGPLAIFLGQCTIVTHFLPIFDALFARMTALAIPPPEVIWVDDWHKWHDSLTKVVCKHWPVNSCIIGQDWFHFSNLMTVHMDQSHPLSCLQIKQGGGTMLTIQFCATGFAGHSCVSWHLTPCQEPLLRQPP